MTHWQAPKNEYFIKPQIFRRPPPPRPLWTPYMNVKGHEPLGHIVGELLTWLPTGLLEPNAKPIDLPEGPTFVANNDLDLLVRNMRIGKITLEHHLEMLMSESTTPLHRNAMLLDEPTHIDQQPNVDVYTTHCNGNWSFKIFQSHTCALTPLHMCHNSQPLRHIESMKNIK